MANIFRELFLYPNLAILHRRLKQNKSPVVLTGTPIHKNLGDHLIAQKVLEFLQAIHKDQEILEIPTEIFVLYKEKFVDLIDSNAVIYISGGGWMGDIWAQDDQCMQDIISTFNNNKIIILPQTLYFVDENTESGIQLISSAKSVYSNCHSLILCLRDRGSYECAQRLYSKYISNIGFFPDMALYSDFDQKKSEKSGIILCLRDDRERVRAGDVEEKVLDYAKGSKKTVKQSSTIAKHAVPIWARSHFINNKSKEFSGAEIVVTDRLHGMIYSVLSDTKCVAIDNKTHKVKGVYEQWISSNKNVVLLAEDCGGEDVIHAITALLALKSDNKPWREKTDEEFLRFKNYLEERI